MALEVSTRTGQRCEHDGKVVHLPVKVVRRFGGSQREPIQNVTVCVGPLVANEG